MQYICDNSTALAFAYTETGRLQSATDAQGTTTYGYDALGRVARIDFPDGRYVAYAYDLAGNLTQLQTPTRTVSYGYDALNRPVRVTDESGTTTYGYDAVGNLTETAYPNGTRTRYAYDLPGRVASIVHTDVSDLTFAAYDYTYDASGNRTRVVEKSGRTVDYAYDESNRLIAEMVTNDPDGFDTVTEYEYDAMGNRTARITASATTAYFYDADDRLISDSNGVYAYDDAGNLLGDGNITYGYDAQNRLVSATAPQHQVAYAYDYLGNRIAKTVDGERTDFLINPMATHAQVLQSSGADGATAYTHGLDLISQNSADGTSFFHTDALGSTRALSNTAGAAVNHLTYAPFGRLLRQTGTVPTAFGFTGEQYDAETGNYYLRARYYSPNTGRFTQYDTFGGYPSDPMTLNHYLYANANPVKYVDPSGHMGMVTSTFSIAGTGIIRGRFVMAASIRYAKSALLKSLDAATTGVARGGASRGASQGYLGKKVWIKGLEFIYILARLYDRVLAKERDTPDRTPIQVYGSDYIPEHQDHIFDAMFVPWRWSSNKWWFSPSFLHYRGPNNAHDRSWMDKYLPEKKGVRRDEYPYASVEEGGEIHKLWISLRYVSSRESSQQGRFNRALYEGAPVATGGLFVVIPIGSETGYFNTKGNWNPYPKNAR